ncbi:uncharacterized protein C8A04DRAFT_26820 [Dichotomopilus funicola]|uniref:Protein kinase domain-containing protein n=1 Tax=Dichotomopilus funicola TaxID=1934379 RepID=A0AAN6ZPC1_9PEZI|nr:hypothetical protein C8A04DRAFT_26820 [Dichotomopilus funicola]
MLEEPVRLALQGTKRPHESSQLTGESKRGRLGDERVDQASIVFQPAPEALVAQAAATPEPRHQHAVGDEARALVAGFRHPFEELHTGDTAKILGPDGEDYTLSYDKRISLRSNSHVFSAHHSQVPEQLVVVKVVRSPSGPIALGESYTVGDKLRRTAEVWLREVKIHSQLSQHKKASVVRLHDHDARFLALYMENVDAPSLLQYRCDTMTLADHARVLSDTATALLYIHHQGFVHNDIKPGNILFSRERGAVVIDFGVSSEIAFQSVNTGGTPWYVPPEYAETRIHYTARGDEIAVVVWNGAYSGATSKGAPLVTFLGNLTNQSHGSLGTSQATGNTSNSPPQDKRRVTPAMSGVLPTPDYGFERHRRWPWWKFEMHPTDLFTTLHARFNTRTSHIQDPGAFIVDVRECIDESPDIGTFYAKMDERRDKRVHELEGAWFNVCRLMMTLITEEPICGDPNCKSLDTDSKLPRVSKNDTRWDRAAALAHMSRTMAFDNMVDFFEGFVRDKRERELRKKELPPYPPKPLQPPAIAPIFPPPLSPVSAPSDRVDEVTATTQKSPDQSNAGKPTPVPATDGSAKTAAPSWQPRAPSSLPALSPSPPDKRRKTDEEEACSEGFADETASPVSRKRRRSITGSGTDGGDDDGTASGCTNTSRKRARATDGGTAPEDGQPRGGRRSWALENEVESGGAKG